MWTRQNGACGATNRKARIMQVMHIIEWLRTKPNTYAFQQQIAYYGWLQTGVWGGHVTIGE